jgi:hypothetical protein
MNKLRSKNFHKKKKNKILNNRINKLKSIGKASK